MISIEKQANENLKAYKELVAFIKTLDANELEEFISVILENGKYPDTRDELRKTFKRMQETQ